LNSPAVIITGSTSGIGLSLARLYCKRGYSVCISGRNVARLNETADELQKYGDRILAVQADVSVEEDCKKLIDSALSRFGRLDTLINNAGVSMRGLFHETDPMVLQQLMNTNFWGTVNCTRHAMPHLIKTKGSVVGISSIAGKIGLPGRTGYSASKFAMEGFLEALRIENLKTGVHVLVACPGFTASNIRSSSLGPDGKPQKESPRDESSMMTADEVALAISRAIDKRKRDLVMTANGKLSILLNRLFPAFADKLVYNHLSKEPGSPFK
jgi:dehydrogenase/reductase SDR family member 7B